MIEDIDIKKIFELTDKMSKRKKKLLNKAPFHFNLIDEIGANENSHSRIIGKLLSYKENDIFINFIFFLKHVGLNLSPFNPKIFVEKDRIDITILDRDYAIIIENKIHYAKDQDEQLSNYLEKVKNKNYKSNQVYVLYLTRWGDKKPMESSLPQKVRKELGDRYIEINFRNHILPWIEEIFQNSRQKDQELISALRQYIDHLEGLLNLRIKNNFMNKELNELIAKEISLVDDFKKNDIIISKKIDELNLCLSHLNSLRIDVRNKLRKEFLQKLFDKLNRLETGWYCVNKIHNRIEISEANSEYFGFCNDSYQYENTNINFSIEIQKWKIFLCGIFCTDRIQREKIKQKLKENGVELISNNSDWLYLDTRKYNYKNREPAYFVYDDEWNKFYIDDMEGMVNVFFEKIIEVFEGWKRISKKRSDNKT